MTYMLIENSEQGQTHVELERTEASSFTSSRYGSAVEITFTQKYEEDFRGERKEPFTVVLRKNEWVELKRNINEIVEGV